MNVLKEFFIFKRPNNNTVSAQCTICEKHYLDKIGSTGNFHKHLKRKHNLQYEKFRSSTSITPLENDDDDDLENETNYTKKINEAILEQLIIKCNLPMSIVEHVNFRNFLKRLSPKWKSTSARHFTNKLLPLLFDKAQAKMKCLLNDVTHLSITVDVWTDRRVKSFLGITGHFIDVNYIPQAFLLDFCRLKGSHTGDNVRNMTEKMLEGLQIKHKVYRIITDNAASMIKAYKFGLAASNPHEILVNQDHEEEEKYKESIVESNDDSSDFLRRWTLTDWYEENEQDSNDIDVNIASRLSCFAHSLQLTVRDGIANVSYLAKCLLKCIKLAEWSHKSPKIADLLDDMGKSINQRTVTRWSSEYLLMKSILSLGKGTVDDITELLEDNEVKFNNSDFIVLQEAVELLEPFAEITVRVQSQSIVSASLVVPSVVHLLDHINLMKSSLRVLKSMCMQLEQSIHRRFAGIVKRLQKQSVNASDPFSDRVYFVCTILDPEFKLYWLSQMNYNPVCESKIKESLVQMVLDECDYGQNRSSHNIQETLSSSSSRSIDMDDSMVQSTRTTTNKKRKLFQYSDDNSTCDVSSNSLTSPMNEINAYLNDPLRCNFSLYWKNSQLHTLKNVVKRVYSIQATSAPIERAFSRAGIIMSPRRTSMREEVFRSLVFLRMNENLI